jgi:hypothetical protein
MKNIISSSLFFTPQVEDVGIGGCSNVERRVEMSKH